MNAARLPHQTFDYQTSQDLQQNKTKQNKTKQKQNKTKQNKNKTKLNKNKTKITQSSIIFVPIIASMYIIYIYLPFTITRTSTIRRSHSID